MKIENTSIEGVFIFKPKVFNDPRGYFIETFKQKSFKDVISNVNFIQDNESKAMQGVLRGLHFQKPPYAQSKLVRVVDGKVQDVIVDLRKGSRTFGRYESFILSSENKFQLFIPKGFAHGFLTLSETAIFSYKVDNPYSPDHEIGIQHDDEFLNIKWALPSDKIILSKKDKKLNSFTSKNFQF